MSKSVAVMVAALPAVGRLAFAAVVAVSLAGLARAQGDGGSQTACELQYSTCKQTARADYQFCRTASEKNCRQRLNRSLQSCRSSQSRCANSTAGTQFSG
ncbi:hypothetical protein [Variovorax sp. J31P207]|uniref:hypothetical protein n=1 Tax=Variovorax sp. J31P207 TaxID=3053510 RepID=UPI002575F529|nr:hypothetical protein [Variovorax sp. J31P207]MDM0066096.1 hypothetical protein [Variovorax sp. J31P207]